MSKKTVVLLSGGPDSAVAAYNAVSQGHEVHTLTLMSKSRGHNLVEVSYAERMAKHLKVPHETIDVSSLTSLFSDRPNYKFAVGGARDCLPEGQVVAPLSVEFMHMLACIYATSHGIDNFVWSIHRKDVDEDLEWERDAMKAYETLISLRVGRPFTFEMPFLEMEKADVLKLGQELGVPYEDTFSCFSSLENIHCGKCYKCHERRSQFALAGVPDLAKYAANDDYKARNPGKRYYNIPEFA
jgi:7-cyano-7-deazaguanine synthase